MNSKIIKTLLLLSLLVFVQSNLVNAKVDTESANDTLGLYNDTNNVSVNLANEKRFWIASGIGINTSSSTAINNQYDYGKPAGQISATISSTFGWSGVEIGLKNRNIGIRAKFDLVKAEGPISATGGISGFINSGNVELSMQEYLIQGMYFFPIEKNDIYLGLGLGAAVSSTTANLYTNYSWSKNPIKSNNTITGLIVPISIGGDLMMNNCLALNLDFTYIASFTQSSMDYNLLKNTGNCSMILSPLQSSLNVKLLFD